MTFFNELIFPCEHYIFAFELSLSTKEACSFSCFICAIFAGFTHWCFIAVEAYSDSSIYTSRCSAIIVSIMKSNQDQFFNSEALLCGLCLINGDEIYIFWCIHSNYWDAKNQNWSWWNLKNHTLHAAVGTVMLNALGWFEITHIFSSLFNLLSWCRAPLLAMIIGR